LPNCDLIINEKIIFTYYQYTNIIINYTYKNYMKTDIDITGKDILNILNILNILFYIINE